MESVEFIPKRLIRARESIALIHRHTEEPTPISMDDELRKLIISLVSLEKYQVKARAYTLTKEEMDLVAGYIPHNYYNVELANLCKIFSIRTSDRLCTILFNQWQEAYNNVSCNAFLRELLDYDEHFIVLIQKNNMEEAFFKDILQDSNIAYRFGKEALIKPASTATGKTLADRMAFWGIREDSKLYSDCSFLFYTYCGREDYLVASKIALLNYVKQYEKKGIETLQGFLRNFLLKMWLKDLLLFKDIAMFLQSIIGDNRNNRKKFDAFFENFDPILVRKYINWINLFKIEEYFGSDERSAFWKKYKFESVRKYSYSNAVVMEFECYYAVEFLGKAMGPIYIYSKGNFEEKIIKKFWSYNNQQLRKELYHNSVWFYRKEHLGYWQGEVHRHLINNNITEPIVL